MDMVESFVKLKTNLNGQAIDNIFKKINLHPREKQEIIYKRLGIADMPLDIENTIKLKIYESHPLRTSRSRFGQFDFENLGGRV